MSTYKPIANSLRDALRSSAFLHSQPPNPLQLPLAYSAPPLTVDNLTDIGLTAVPIAQLGDDFTKKGHHCDYCDCSVDPSHPAPKVSYSGQGGRGGRSLLPKAVWSAIHETYCRRVYITEGGAVNLLRRSELDSPHLLSTMQWNLTNAQLGLPTSYIFTKTSWRGRTGPAREGYFRRHMLTLRNHLLEMSNDGWPESGHHEGRKRSDRQIIWIIVEDDEVLQDDIAELIADSDIPYIYFAFGATRHYGNAQQNAAYSLIKALSNPETGLFGHGPVISLDDDNYVLPALLKIIWNTKRIGTWPMGNLGPEINEAGKRWEGPVYDKDNKFLRWDGGATSNRAFPIDNGAFAFRTELFLKEIQGPKLWPTNMMGGESEFMSRLVKAKEDIEPLCFNCRLAWHNQPLPLHCIDEACGG